MLVGKCPKSGFEMLVVKTLCREKARRFNCNVTTFTRPYDRYRQTDSLSEPLFIKTIYCHDLPTRPTMIKTIILQRLRQGWQSIDRPGKPKWENPGFSGLALLHEIAHLGNTGQYDFCYLFVMKVNEISNLKHLYTA